MNLTTYLTLHDEDDMSRFMFYEVTSIFAPSTAGLIIYLILVMTCSSVISLQLSATILWTGGCGGYGDNVETGRGYFKILNRMASIVFLQR